MRCHIHKRLVAVFLIVLTLLLTAGSTWSYASDSEETKYYLGQDSLVNTGGDNGYTGTEQIKANDPHSGWELGQFYVTGFTRVQDDNGTPMFLKNVGDTVTLWFQLEQDINCLNGNEALTISEDTNGWDPAFKNTEERQNFGRGMLIVRHIDYQNQSTETTYQNFLAANATTTAATQVDLFEEGDYEVALDYEIKETNVDLLGWNPFSSYTHYRISFTFSVRNGNAMVFPFDVKTGEELTNASFTENGFYLDLAKSRYLDIDIKKEVLNESADGVVTDVRFNKPARDGNEYTEEGIYTITVSNRYTGSETTKTIYVGTNDVLKASVVTGLSVSEIEAQVAEGATIAEDGSILSPEMPPEDTQATASGAPSEPVPEAPSISAEPGQSNTSSANDLSSTGKLQIKQIIVPAAIGILILFALICIIVVMKKRNSKKSVQTTESRSDKEDEAQ